MKSLFLLMFSIVTLSTVAAFAQEPAPAPQDTQVVQPPAQPAPTSAPTPVLKSLPKMIKVTQEGLVTYKGKELTDQKVTVSDRIPEGAPYATGSANYELCEKRGWSKEDCGKFERNPRYADITVVPKVTDDGKIIVSGIYIAYDNDGKFVERRIVYSLLNNGDSISFKTKRNDDTFESTKMIFSLE